MSEIIREYRVWNETGDYMGGADVTRGTEPDTYMVVPHPFTHGDDAEEIPFWDENRAYEHAKELAEKYMAEAIADFTAEYGEAPTGVMGGTGYSIQVCEGNNDITGSI